MKVLLVIPPLVQINCAYPATAYITGFLHEKHPELEVSQRDLGLELVLALFSKAGLKRIKAAVGKKAPLFTKNYAAYAKSIEPTIAYLQGKNPSLTDTILNGGFLPQGPRFEPLSSDEHLQEKFAALTDADQAKHLASLYLDDLADLIRFAVDERFEFSRYGERLAASQNSFDPLYKNLQKTSTLVDEILEELTTMMIQEEKPDLLGLTVPFSGTVYGALRIGKITKKISPQTKVAMGGGYANTELRELTDARIFEFVDFITLDDGERPLECLLEHIKGKRPLDQLLRTFALDENKKVKLYSSPLEHDIPFRDTGTPSYKGLPLDRYVSLFEMLNPVNRLWSDGRWNKLTLAHGCYWKKCAFCDTSLDYIGRFEAEKAEKTLAKMIQITEETGFNGFHFVDEAAPPATLSALADAILASGRKFVWWGNIRFDKTFTSNLTDKMKAAGCIAVTGGLEVASPRILQLIQKGVSIEQVAKVTKAFQESGIFVHAYLMFGFPSQTPQETIDSLEVVRQLFAEHCLNSAFWHRFAATTHSPVGKNPEKFGVKILAKKPSSQYGIFAVNDLDFIDLSGHDHDAFGPGLRKALYNYMHGVGIDADVREWFEERVPKPKIPATFIRSAL